MPLKVTKIDVWSGEIQDQPGGLVGFYDSSPAQAPISRWWWPVGSPTDRVLGSSFSRR